MLSHVREYAASVRVVDDVLIVNRLAEGPDGILVETVVEYGNIRVGWVSVHRLALSVVEVKFLISVRNLHDCRRADGRTFLWHARLQTLEVVCLGQPDVIDRAVIVGVRGQVLIESHQRIVVHHIVLLAHDEAAEAKVETIVDGEAVVLIVPGSIFKRSMRKVCGAHALRLTILVDAPQVLYAFADSLLVAVLAEEVWGHSKECDVLSLELENGCIKYERG